jgi:hypothetical protein
MNTAPAIELRTFITLDTARGDLLDVYAEVRAPHLHLPNYAVIAFGERLDRHGGEPGFVAVLAYADGHPVGYAYGNTIEHGDRYWQRTSPTPAREVHRAPGRGTQGNRRPPGLAEDGHRTPHPRRPPRHTRRAIRHAHGQPR